MGDDTGETDASAMPLHNPSGSRRCARPELADVQLVSEPAYPTSAEQNLDVVPAAT